MRTNFQKEPPATLDDLQPMLLTDARPFSAIGWAFEVKFDGYRALAEWNAGTARLKSRRGTDMSRWFPEIVLALSSLRGGRCVVDGEIAVLNEHGIAGDAEFRELFRRQARRGYRKGDPLVTYCVFDALVIRSRSVMHRPLLERKALATKHLSGAQQVMVVPHILEQGEAVYRAAVELGLEGIVAKRIAAPYQMGERTKDWLKIKRPGAVPSERFGHR